MTLPRLIFPVCGQTRKHSGRLFHLSFSFVDSRSLQNCNAWQDKFFGSARSVAGKEWGFDVGSNGKLLRTHGEKK